MTRKTRSSPSPRRVTAGKRNRLKRGPLTPEGRQRLRKAALRNRPWEHSTGPRTTVGKARSARNGKLRQKGEMSIRERKAELAPLHELIAQMGKGREQAAP